MTIACACPGDQTPLARRGMASLALLASLGSLHVDWTRGYRMTWHMANPSPGDAPGAVSLL